MPSVPHMGESGCVRQAEHATQLPLSQTAPGPHVVSTVHAGAVRQSHVKQPNAFRRCPNAHETPGHETSVAHPVRHAPSATISPPKQFKTHVFRSVCARPRTTPQTGGPFVPQPFTHASIDVAETRQVPVAPPSVDPVAPPSGMSHIPLAQSAFAAQARAKHPFAALANVAPRHVSSHALMYSRPFVSQTGSIAFPAQSHTTHRPASHFSFVRQSLCWAQVTVGSLHTQVGQPIASS